MVNAPASFRLPRWLEAILAIVIVVELIAPFVATTYGTDGPTHMYWTEQFYQLLRSGEWIPRWNPHGFFGYGSPAFYFYPPLYFYFSSGIKYIFGLTNPLLLMQTCGLLLTVASFFSCRVFLRNIGVVPYQATLGACLYAFAPFRIAELYSRTSMPSHLGYAILPLVWLGLYTIVKFPETSRGILFTAVCASLLFLSTIPLTVGTAAIILLIVTVERKRLSFNVFKKLSLTVLVTIVLCSYQILSIVQHVGEVQFDRIERTPDYLLLDLFKGTMLPAVYHFLLLYLALIAIVVFIRHPKYTPRESEIVKIGLSLLFFFLFLDLPYISTPLWAIVSELAQGSWRFYIYFLLFSAVAVGFAESRTMRIRATIVTALWTLGAIIPLFLIISNIHFYRHDAGRSGDTPEYLPRGASMRAIQPVPSQVSQSGLTALPRFYWPEQRLFVNGAEILTIPDSLGRARAILPPNTKMLVWKVERTPGERAGLWASGIAWTALLFFGAGVLLRRLFHKTPPSAHA